MLLELVWQYNTNRDDPWTIETWLEPDEIINVLEIIPG